MADEKKEVKEEKKEEVKEEVKEEKAAPEPTPTPPAEAAATVSAAPAATPAPAAEAPKAEAAPAAAQSPSNGTFPAELSGWNWGAFWLTWIWSIGNSTWIGLLALISPISLIMAIILGIKGNEWAWNNRKFESVDQFKKVQHAWAVWGLVLFLISAVLMVIMMATGVVAGLKSAKNVADDALSNLNTNTSVEIPADSSAE